MEVNNEIVLSEMRFSKSDSCGDPYLEVIRVAEISEYDVNTDNVEIMIQSGHYVRFKFGDLLDRLGFIRPKKDEIDE